MYISYSESIFFLFTFTKALSTTFAQSLYVSIQLIGFCAKISSRGVVTALLDSTLKWNLEDYSSSTCVIPILTHLIGWSCSKLEPTQLVKSLQLLLVEIILSVHLFYQNVLYKFTICIVLLASNFFLTIASALKWWFFGGGINSLIGTNSSSGGQYKG